MWLRTPSELPDGHLVFEQRLEDTKREVRQVLSTDAVSGSISSACMKVMSSFAVSLNDPALQELSAASKSLEEALAQAKAACAKSSQEATEAKQHAAELYDSLSKAKAAGAETTPAAAAAIDESGGRLSEVLAELATAKEEVTTLASKLKDHEEKVAWLAKAKEEATDLAAWLQLQLAGMAASVDSTGDVKTASAASTASTASGSVGGAALEAAKGQLPVIVPVASKDGKEAAPMPAPASKKAPPVADPDAHERPDMVDESVMSSPIAESVRRLSETEAVEPKVIIRQESNTSSEGDGDYGSPYSR